MLNIEAKTKLSWDETVSRIKEFFDGRGLKLVDENGGCLSFEGGGGYVNATVSEESNKRKIELTTQEWEFQVREFVANLR
jgi:hypothetical protein